MTNENPFGAGTLAIPFTWKRTPAGRPVEVGSSTMQPAGNRTGGADAPSASSDRSGGPSTAPADKTSE